MDCWKQWNNVGKTGNAGALKGKVPKEEFTENWQVQYEDKTSECLTHKNHTNIISKSRHTYDQNA